ncbi:MAG: D-tyrosyl-tRNA(Tyr) deacylase [Candidatus Glassbacteria bacterium RIFCSPLOWO2_12_FULL_58_11]|uniref:D-aminoacyl-tRNA deacylase n=1 Tax=Candidatus Glassbacteria bacterium RIFCSPLOWO2_12_FULL_58_11 TaxID=1817867 RepID=A0A1F5Z0M4_9BACT|nr:MAG: D-tyrosyl-tRNA(Tyr) deacylase [Candidatus Glassbacteria bacterium RIFCSPLOWO2_12_FULL_58_11]
MRVVVQRVSRASVTVEGETTGAIGTGFLLLVAMHGAESEEDLVWMARRCAGLRVFQDEAGKMNLALDEVGGAILVVSQFTLYGDCSKGRRPSFVKAGDPVVSEKLIERFVGLLRAEGLEVATGRFGAMMKVELVNEGPVTLIIDR